MCVYFYFQCVWYLGDRVWRQLTGDASVPINSPPASLLVSVGDWGRWVRDQLVPILAVNLRVEVNDTQWMQYWRSVTHGPILPGLYREANADWVNPTQSWDHTIRPSRPRMFEERGPYEAPPMDDLTQYFMDMSLSVPGSDQVVHIPTRDIELPSQLHPVSITLRMVITR